jgi:hypothetical protein
MCSTRWTAVLCCLALLSAASPAAAEGSSAGQIALAVAEPGGVALGIDLGALAQGLCAGGLPALRASAECGLTAGNHRNDEQERSTSIGLWSGEAKATWDGRFTVEVAASNLDLAGPTLETPCGDLWQYSVLLDPAAVQKPALLTLHPAVSQPAQGMFAGVIEVAAVLHLVPLDADGHPDEHAAIDLPFDVLFQLAGAWGTAPAPRPGSTDSNLLLFAGSAGGAWLSRPGCQWTVFDGVWCKSCLEAEAAVLERFNAKPF